VDTTDGMHKPEGLTDREALALMKSEYQQIVEVAAAYEITINI
jgi:inosose dehydratase